MSERSTRTLVHGALLLQTAISAGTYLAVKHALSVLDWRAVVTVRNVGASVLLAGLVLALPGPALPSRKSLLRVLVLGALAIPLNQAFFVAGLAETSPVHAALLYAMTPLFVLFAGLLRKSERATPWKLAGLFSALAGAAVVVTGRVSGPAGSDPMRGDLLILAAVVAWAVYTVLGKDLVREAGPLKATAWAMISGTIMLLPIGLETTTRVAWSDVPGDVWAAMAFLVVLTSVVSYLCWSYALAHIEPSRVAIFTNLQPVATALLAWALMHERITLTLVVGGGLVLAGVYAASQPEKVSGR